LLYLVLKILLYPVHFLPRRWELFLGDMLGYFLYRGIRFKRTIVRRNLLLAYEEELRSGKMAMNEIRNIERKNYSHYGRLIFEFLHIPVDAMDYAQKHVRVHNIEHLKNAMLKGKGVFFLTAHIGCWEMMSVLASQYSVPLNVITKYLRVKSLDDAWIKSRASYGIKLIDEVSSARTVLKAIRAGEVVGVVLDQFMGPPVGERIRFFNKPAWTISSLAWFIQKTGSPVVPVVNYRRDDGSFDLYIYPELDFEKVGIDSKNIRHNTQRYTNIIESFIRRCPEQWIWVHRRWKRVKEDDAFTI